MRISTDSIRDLHIVIGLVKTGWFLRSGVQVRLGFGSCFFTRENDKVTVNVGGGEWWDGGMEGIAF